jgi:hypothetical protein
METMESGKMELYPAENPSKAPTPTTWLADAPAVDFFAAAARVSGAEKRV